MGRLPALELDEAERLGLKALTARRETGQALALRARTCWRARKAWRTGRLPPS